jgi:hypothetical protein
VKNIFKPHDFLSDLCDVNEFNQYRESLVYNKRNKLLSCTSCVNSSLFLLLSYLTQWDDKPKNSFVEVSPV